MTLDVYSHLWPDSDDSTRAAVDLVPGDGGVTDSCQAVGRWTHKPVQTPSDGESACRRDTVPDGFDAKIEELPGHGSTVPGGGEPSLCSAPASPLGGSTLLSWDLVARETPSVLRTSSS